MVRGRLKCTKKRKDNDGPLISIELKQRNSPRHSLLPPASLHLQSSLSTSGPADNPFQYQGAPALAPLPWMPWHRGEGGGAPKPNVQALHRGEVQEVVRTGAQLQHQHLLRACLLAFAHEPAGQQSRAKHSKGRGQQTVGLRRGTRVGIRKDCKAVNVYPSGLATMSEFLCGLEYATRTLSRSRRSTPPRTARGPPAARARPRAATAPRAPAHHHGRP